MVLQTATTNATSPPILRGKSSEKQLAHERRGGAMVVCMNLKETSRHGNSVKSRVSEIGTWLAPSSSISTLNPPCLYWYKVALR